MAQLLCQFGCLENALNMWRRLIVARTFRRSWMAEKFCRKKLNVVTQFLINKYDRSGEILEDITRMQDIPKKLSSTSFKNMIIDYWMYRVETSCNVNFKLMP